jgi:hypothetical protein
MIPTWGSKRKDLSPSYKDNEVEFEKLPADEALRTKECAICRRSNADYEHTCGVAFHKVCIEEYFNAISNVDGAERICPHCYAPMPLDLDSGKVVTIEVAPLSEEFYNQYLELSDEFSLALIDGRIMDISVFLNSPTGDQYYVNVDFSNYPNKPTFSFTDELLANIDGLYELMEELNNWDSEFPPRLVDIINGIETRIKPKDTKEVVEIEDVGEGDITEGEDEENALKQEQEMEIVEVLPEDEIVEVTLETQDVNDEDTTKLEEFSPATFFELVEETSSESYENEEAIQQYLNLSNNFSVELVSDEIYNVIIYLSCLDAGIYNIYPVTINFKDYPKKPIITFTDDLLVRIRGLDRILNDLKAWNRNIPLNLVDIVQKFETRLVEDSLVENEIEVIKREYKTKRLGKNRIQVTLFTYGQKYYDIELDLKYHPDPPVISLPEELRDIDVEELEGIKKWPEKPQKRIMDVLRSISHAINNLQRMEFEELLLRMVAEDFEVIGKGYRAVLGVPNSIEREMDMDNASIVYITLTIEIPRAYPYVPPDIEVNSDDQELKERAKVFLTDLLKSWVPNIFLADAINRLSLSLSNTSLFRCFICGQRECPICGLPLLTVPVEESERICEMPCIHCNKPYHVHCLKGSLQEGNTQCSYCLSDLSGFFRNNIYNIIS